MCGSQIFVFYLIEFWFFAFGVGLKSGHFEVYLVAGAAAPSPLNWSPVSMFKQPAPPPYP